MSASNGRRVTVSPREAWRDRLSWWARGVVVIAVFIGSWWALVAFAHWLESLLLKGAA